MPVDLHRQFDAPPRRCPLPFRHFARLSRWMRVRLEVAEGLWRQRVYIAETDGGLYFATDRFGPPWPPVSLGLE